MNEAPTAFHITHHKAGSQWIHKILRELAPDRVVRPDPEGAFVRNDLSPGRIYPTVYMRREAFEQLQRPAGSRQFVVIRDLRDTLVSGYWSLKVSHRTGRATHVDEARSRLAGMTLHDGLRWTLEHWLGVEAEIQRSWLAADDAPVRYEDLIDDDVGILVPLLTDQLGITEDRERAEAVVLACRFDAVTAGRKRGVESVGAHQRKGVVGDWRNYLGGPLRDEFKDRFGDLLIASGYESDLDW